MDATTTQRKHFARTSGVDADGEVVWSFSPAIFSFAKERIKQLKNKYLGGSRE
jgi:hypothetical protein